jgi:cysteine desulfurase
MQTLKAFLTGLRGEGSLSLLAGHYAWPGRPDSLGIDSAAHLADVLEELEPAAVDAHIFIDDIAASTMCSEAWCGAGAGAPLRLTPLSGEGLEPWVASCLPAVESLAIDRGDSWREQARLLAQFLSTLPDAEARHPLIASLQEPARYDRLAGWLEDVETLVYISSKPAFRPLFLSYETGRRLPKVLFERTITNAASRMLHRVLKSGVGTNLRVSADDSGGELYWVQDEGGNRIELRNEAHHLDGVRASNKCSAILSQLFFYASRALKKVSTPGSSLSVFYIIPSYDRARLRDGMKSFFEIYSEFEHWFGVRRIDLASAFYTYPDRSEMLCEVYSLRPGASRPVLSTHRILTKAVRGRRGSPAASARIGGRERIYADHNATTPLDPRVLQKMMPFLTDEFGNASSAHSYGWEAELAVAEARQQVAALINAEPDEIFFTSGATESNNWFLKQSAKRPGARFVSSALEHKAVLESLDDIRRGGAGVEYLPFDRAGRVDLAAVGARAQSPGAVVTLMAVNNEVHSLLDLDAVGGLCRRADAVFHTDAAQALGKVPIDVRRKGIDAMSMSAHKIYGPKGVGALFVSGRIRKTVAPFMSGGGQEHGMRSGTLATSLIVGFGEACAIAEEQMESEARRLYGLSELLLSRLESEGVSYRVIGPGDVRERQPGSLSLSIARLNAEKLSELIPEVALSRGSACNSLESRNHVLKALGLGSGEESSVVRLSFGRFNDASQVLYIADRITEVVSGSRHHIGRTVLSV